jgi:hypothetical protein
MGYTPGVGDDDLKPMIIGGPTTAARVMSLLSFLLLVGVVLAALVFLFFWFTGVWRLAVGFGVLMAAFMTLTAWLAGRSPAGRDNAMH